MIYDLVVHEKTYRFRENGHGALELFEDGLDGRVELLPRKEIVFPYDEIQRSARLVTKEFTWIWNFADYIVA